MKLHVIAFLAAAVSTTGAITEAKSSRDGTTQERAIIIQHSGGNFWDSAFKIIRHHYPDAKRYPLDSSVIPSNGERTYTVAITFSTTSHGRHTMWFRAASRDFMR
jgi:hypothetical protein